MGLKDWYCIKKIDYKTAMAMVIKNHYLHRKTSCSFAFGLFEIATGGLIGCITYGTPSSAPLRAGICGPDESKNVIELTRLWIADHTVKNCESFLIGNTIPLVDKEIIVSFAEINAGHSGVIYQATNWIYTGLSAKRTNWTIRGDNRHQQSIADSGTAKELKAKYGADFYLTERPRKHRYIYFNCSKTRKKQLLKKLRYEVQQYPKK